MKLPFFIGLITVSTFLSCTKDAPITRPVAVSETQETTVEDRNDEWVFIDMQVWQPSTSPAGYKPYIIVYDERGSTRYVFPWACSNQGCTSSPCTDAEDDSNYQTFKVKPSSKIKVQLFEVDPLLDCKNGTGSVTLRLKKPGSNTVRTITLNYTGGINYPSRCFSIYSNGDIGPAELCADEF